MAFLPAEKSRLLLGSLNLSVYTKQFGTDWRADMHDVTCHANADNTDMKAKAFVAGQESGNVQASGPLDTAGAQGGQWDVLADWKGASPLAMTYAPSGLVTGSEAWLYAVLESALGETSSQGGVVSWTVNAQCTGALDVGVVVENLTEVTIDGNGTARDLTAQTTNGGVAHLHVPAFSGLTNDIVTIEHSVDGSTSWATLVTFATVTGLTSERVEVAAATTVRRYLRVVDNVTGTGAITRAVSFARR